MTEFGRRSAPAVSGTEFTGVRPYQTGDRLSSVHWRGFGGPVPLLVRELAAAATFRRRVILDDRAGVHRRASFESALRLLTGQLLGPTDSLEVRSITLGAIAEVAGSEPRPSVLRWLAAVEPRFGAGEASGSTPFGTGDVVITTTTGARSLDRLAAAGVRFLVTA
ncbi:MAG: DUF58 domain-containing protein [Acidimicrobiales bacterium]